MASEWRPARSRRGEGGAILAPAPGPTWGRRTPPTQGDHHEPPSPPPAPGPVPRDRRRLLRPLVAGARRPRRVSRDAPGQHGRRVLRHEGPGSVPVDGEPRQPGVEAVGGRGERGHARLPREDPRARLDPRAPGEPVELREDQHAAAGGRRTALLQQEHGPPEPVGAVRAGLGRGRAARRGPRRRRRGGRGRAGGGRGPGGGRRGRGPRALAPVPGGRAPGGPRR